MEAVLGKNSNYNSILEKLKQMALEDNSFREAFQKRSYNEFYNLIVTSQYRIAMDNRKSSNTVLVDFGHKILEDAAIAFYLKNATEDDLYNIFKESVDKVITVADNIKKVQPPTAPPDKASNGDKSNKGKALATSASGKAKSAPLPPLMPSSPAKQDNATPSPNPSPRQAPKPSPRPTPKPTPRPKPTPKSPAKPCSTDTPDDLLPF